ncbi:MAG: dihydropteroate synthase [Bacteroidota bacterium]
MTINCNGQLVNISTPKVMGILNVTPDSFYDGGQNMRLTDIFKSTEKMLSEGATFIDVGGYSSRPGADDISVEEELRRVVHVIEELVKIFPEIIISIDTFRSKIAKASVEAGAAIVNDISGGLLDKEMLSTVGKLSVPYVMMHMKGTPQNMKEKAHYKNITHEVIKHLSERLVEARANKIIDIIADPGFGFAKNIQQNFELFSNLELLKNLDIPLLVGISRKSMIYKTLDTTPSDALNGTTALNMLALEKGANILRVHDVKEAMECVTLFNKMHQSL